MINTGQENKNDSCVQLNLKALKPKLVKVPDVPQVINTLSFPPLIVTAGRGQLMFAYTSLSIIKI